MLCVGFTLFCIKLAMIEYWLPLPGPFDLAWVYVILHYIRERDEANETIRKRSDALAQEWEERFRRRIEDR